MGLRRRLTYHRQVPAFVRRVVVALITSVAVAAATLDPCALTCHPPADSTPASRGAHCPSASGSAPIAWQSATACHHNHDVAAFDATPQPRVECSTPIHGIVQDTPVVTAAAAAGLHVGAREPRPPSSSSASFDVPLRL